MMCFVYEIIQEVKKYQLEIIKYLKIQIIDGNYFHEVLHD
jgi:hypothetical protein